MSSDNFLTVQISRAYVLKWLAFTALLSSAFPLGLSFFMWHLRFDTAVAVGVAATFLFLLWVLLRTYRRGVKQAIYLHPDKIIFDYITYTQEFMFGSPGEWRISEEKGNWKIQALSDQSFRLVPKSAFPEFKAIASGFYALDAQATRRGAFAPQLW
ncbi:MAG TPA: hypothetical protein VIU93_09475 [Gallionellaceae bacterium]